METILQDQEYLIISVDRNIKQVVDDTEKAAKEVKKAVELKKWNRKVSKILKSFN
jgi:hypothetical protein